MNKRIYEIIANVNRDLLEDVEKDYFEEFDELNLDGIRGTGPKMFARCKGSLLLDMYDEIKSNPDTNFVTCMDSLIFDPEYSREDFANTRVSCILREARARNKSYVKAELIGSRVAELFGVKTSYIAPLPNDPQKYICVDFLQNNQELTEISTFVNSKLLDIKGITIKSWLETLIPVANQKIPENTQNRYEIIDNIIVDIIRMYLVKLYVLKDSDFTGKNVAMIHTCGYSDYAIAPSFDHEYSMFQLKSPNDNMSMSEHELLEFSMRYLKKHFPSHLSKAMKDIHLNSPERLEKLNRIIDKFTRGKLESNRYKMFIKDNVCELQKVYNRGLKSLETTNNFTEGRDEKE